MHSPGKIMPRECEPLTRRQNADECHNIIARSPCDEAGIHAFSAPRYRFPGQATGFVMDFMMETGENGMLAEGVGSEPTVPCRHAGFLRPVP